MFLSNIILFITYHCEFQTEGNEEAPKNPELADDAFLMVSQLHWEDDVVWNGDDIKHKVSFLSEIKHLFLRIIYIIKIK